MSDIPRSYVPTPGVFGPLFGVASFAWNGTSWVAGGSASGGAAAGAAGTLMMGVAAAAAPAYVGGTINPYSQTLFGGGRVALIDSAGAELDYTSPALVQGPTAVARLLSAAASTNAANAKAAAGRVFNLMGFNANAAARYLKLYNKATTPVVGTDVPFLTIYLAATAAFQHSFPNGLYLSAGIGFAFTTAGADADVGALTAGDILAFNLLLS